MNQKLLALRTDWIPLRDYKKLTFNPPGVETRRMTRTTVYCQLPQFTMPCTTTADDPLNEVDTADPVVCV